MSGIDLVTGGCGFVGSHLVERLTAQGRRVRVLDNLASGRQENLDNLGGSQTVELVIGNVEDRPAVAEAMRGVERVFHLAALADIVPSIQNPEAYFRANVDGTYAVCEEARQAGVRRLVYAASSSCYGIPDVYPTPESTPADTRYPYALTKFLGEQIVMHWAQVYRLPAVSLRLFNVYGPRARTSGSYGAVFGVFLAQLLAGKPLTIVGDGTQTRDFTFVTDVARAFEMAAGSDKAGCVYNVGTGRDVSVNRIVELIGAGDIVHIPKRPGEPDRTLADTRRIRNDLGWTPDVPIEEGVRILLDNIDYWRGAPIWTTESIRVATKDWFAHLS